jgi:hypothetical protein
MLEFFTALAMFLIGIIVSAIVIHGAQILGISAWIVGPVFCGLLLAFIYANDLLMGFGMRHLTSLLAKLEDTDLSDTEKKEIQGNHTKRIDYLGFLAGSVVGTLASLLLKPSIVLDWIPF